MLYPDRNLTRSPSRSLLLINSTVDDLASFEKEERRRATSPSSSTSSCDSLQSSSNRSDVTTMTNMTRSSTMSNQDKSSLSSSTSRFSHPEQSSTGRQQHKAGSLPIMKTGMSMATVEGKRSMGMHSLDAISVESTHTTSSTNEQDSKLDRRTCHITSSPHSLTRRIDDTNRSSNITDSAATSPSSSNLSPCSSERYKSSMPISTSGDSPSPRTDGEKGTSPSSSTSAKTKTINSKELEQKLRNTHQRSLIVDLRPLKEYLGPGARIKRSINIAFPCLLLRRLSKFPTMTTTNSDFDLGQFVTTDQGKSIYQQFSSAENHSYEVIIIVRDEQDQALNVLIRILEGRDQVVRIGIFASGLQSVEKGLLVVGEESVVELERRSNSEPTPVTRERLLSPFTTSPIRTRAATTTVLPDSDESMIPTFSTKIASPPHLSLSPLRKLKGLRLDTSLSNRSTGSPSAPVFNSLSTSTSLQSLCRSQCSSPLEQSCFESETLKADIFDPSIVIDQFLYLGPEPRTSSHLNELKRLGITTILNSALECRPSLPILTTFQTANYHHFKLRDTIDEPHLPKILSKTTKILKECKERKEKVYVHCKAGKSRSVMIVLAYLIQESDWGLSQSYEFLRGKREGISPNIGFVAELMKWEDRCRGQDDAVKEGTGILNLDSNQTTTL